jgi:hypothetical protein
MFFASESGVAFQSDTIETALLDHPEVVEPDVHIFTRSKLLWFELPVGAHALEALYKLPEV